MPSFHTTNIPKISSLFFSFFFFNFSKFLKTLISNFPKKKKKESLQNEHNSCPVALKALSITNGARQLYTTEHRRRHVWHHFHPQISPILFHFPPKANSLPSTPQQIPHFHGAIQVLLSFHLRLHFRQIPLRHL